VKEQEDVEQQVVAQENKKDGDGSSSSSSSTATVATVATVATAPSPWTLLDDVSLLIGSYKYGTFPKTYNPSAYTDLLKDETLTFHKVLNDRMRAGQATFLELKETDKDVQKHPCKKLKQKIKKRREILCNQLRYFSNQYHISADSADDFDRRYKSNTGTGARKKGVGRGNGRTKKVSCSIHLYMFRIFHLSANNFVLCTVHLD
jgi:hypothetical protein